MLPIESENGSGRKIRGQGIFASLQDYWRAGRFFVRLPRSLILVRLVGEIE